MCVLNAIKTDLRTPPLARLSFLVAALEEVLADFQRQLLGQDRSQRGHADSARARGVSVGLPTSLENQIDRPTVSKVPKRRPLTAQANSDTS